MGQFLLDIEDPDYPRALRELPGAPRRLHCEGRRELLSMPCVAIVGSRQASLQGCEHARRFARSLAAAGYAIASGLARGIDSFAHRGALEEPAGTIAVLGTGIDIVYPRVNRALARRIARDGLLLTEFEPGTPPLRENFPRRNRIIAGLSRGTLVVEAAPRSGSLVTARLAAEAGREVFALPGSILSQLSRGCHDLIRQGAMLVETPQDILAELEPGRAREAGEVLGASGSRVPGEAILRALGHDPADFDTLARRTGLSPGALAARLLELELARQVERLAGNRYQRLVCGRYRAEEPGAFRYGGAARTGHRTRIARSRVAG